MPAPKLDLAAVTTTGDAGAGKLLFHQNCAVCHSANASGHYLPNLQASPMITSNEAFKAVVLDGALKSNGMVSFSKFLTPEQAESIRAYILKLARDG
jgi:quinohemoprotein ethanol dehydrogenase